MNGTGGGGSPGGGPQLPAERLPQWGHGPPAAGSPRVPSEPRVGGGGKGLVPVTAPPPAPVTAPGRSGQVSPQRSAIFAALALIAPCCLKVTRLVLTQTRTGTPVLM